MRFWWLSDCACSAPLRARACCGVRTERARPGLAASVGTVIRCSEAEKSGPEMAEQRQCAGKSFTEGITRAGFDEKYDAAARQRATYEKD